MNITISGRPRALGRNACDELDKAGPECEDSGPFGQALEEHLKRGGGSDRIVAMRDDKPVREILRADLKGPIARS